MAGSDEQHGSDVALSVDAPGPLSRLLEELARVPAGDDIFAAWRDELRPGDRLERFEIRCEIGRGGFGAVYEAFDSALGRVVAVKTLRPGRSRRELSADWVKKEAEAVARLDHPCIVTLFDVGTCPSGPYLVMELLRGESLSQRIEKGQLPLGEALRIAEDMAKGLAHAHQRGVLHRDLKPANVFLCEDGRVKLLDFGLAHLLGHPRERGAGTPAYMAPEQARGDEVDARADVYAAGKVLGEMLGERRPHRLDRAVASATSVTPAARPRDGTAWLDLLQSVRRARERPSRVRHLALIVGTGVVFGAAVAGLGVRRSLRPPEATQTPSPNSIAVLPFADMSPGRDQGYLSDGIAEEILSALSRVEGLKVVGHTSSFSFKGKAQDTAAIAGKLHVAHLLEGSVRRDGNHVRITAQLVSARDGFHLWSETFDREITGVFAIQDEIARAVADALKVKLLTRLEPARVDRRLPNPEAHEQYLLGRAYMRLGFVERYFRLGTEAYERALALDAGYAPAWAGLSRARALLAAFSTTSAGVAEGQRGALAAAEKAIALDPDLPDGYLARAYARQFLAWDLVGAQTDVERGLALSPGYVGAHRGRGLLLMSLGRIREATASLQKAADLDPLAPGPRVLLALAHLALGDTPSARVELERTRELASGNSSAGFYLGVVSLAEGQPAAALAVFERLPDEFERITGVALARHGLGEAAAAQEALGALTTRFQQNSAYQIAGVHAWWGDRDAAFKWLERAYRQHDGGLLQLKYDPLLRPLRDDPRYSALLRKMNLPVD